MLGKQERPRSLPFFVASELKKKIMLEKMIRCKTMQYNLFMRQLIHTLINEGNITKIILTVHSISRVKFFSKSEKEKVKNVLR